MCLCVNKLSMRGCRRRDLLQGENFAQKGKVEGVRGNPQCIRAGLPCWIQKRGQGCLCGEIPFAFFPEDQGGFQTDLALRIRSCRHGFCGACATIYRIKGKNELKTCLACQTQVEEGMYVATVPFFPTDKRTYDIEDIKPEQRIMMDLYPEIYSCIGCNACTKACTQDLNVMQYIAYAQRGEFEKCAEESFDCIGCGCCSVRCPAEISHPMVGVLARRLTGKYIAPESKHLTNRVEEIHHGDYDELIEQIMQKPIEEMQELYNNREIEK